MVAAQLPPAPQAPQEFLRTGSLRRVSRQQHGDHLVELLVSELSEVSKVISKVISLRTSISIVTSIEIMDRVLV